MVYEELPVAKRWQLSDDNQRGENSFFPYKRMIGKKVNLMRHSRCGPNIRDVQHQSQH
jgi:hypothetical protein